MTTTSLLLPSAAFTSVPVPVQADPSWFDFSALDVIPAGLAGSNWNG